MDWISGPFQNVYVEALTLNVMVFRSGTFGRYLGLDDIMRVGLSWWDFYPYKKRKRDQSTVYCFQPREITAKQVCLQAGKIISRYWISRHLDLELPSLQNKIKVRNKCLLFKQPSCYGSLSWLSESFYLVILLSWNSSFKFWNATLSLFSFYFQPFWLFMAPFHLCILNVILISFFSSLSILFLRNPNAHARTKWYVFK